jgi:hypothetical protein
MLIRPVRTVPFVLAVSTLGGQVSALAQQQPPRPPPPPTAVERAALRDSAENAPLFASHEPLQVTLEADFEDLKKDRAKENEREGSFTFPGPDGEPMTVPIKLTTRGIYRLEKSHCNFPPLRLDLPKNQVRGTVFDGQNRLKMVAPCRDDRDDYQNYVLLEYLVYRTFNELSPVSYRVRLLEITFRDTSGRNEELTKYAFLIEDVDRLAERHLGDESEWPQFHPYNMEHRQAFLVSVFQYMVGNTDFEVAFFHNIKMISQEGPTYLVIPYDFDFTGAVDARYARPDRTLPIRRVRDRIYRGFCRDEFDGAPIFALFNERREAIYGMVRGLEPLEEKERERLLEYYDDFYEIINDARDIRQEIYNQCRRPGTG